MAKKREAEEEGVRGQREKEKERESRGEGDREWERVRDTVERVEGMQVVRCSSCKR